MNFKHSADVSGDKPWVSIVICDPDGCFAEIEELKFHGLGGLSGEGYEEGFEAALDAEAHKVLLGDVGLVAGGFESVVQIARNAEWDVGEFGFGSGFSGVSHAGFGGVGGGVDAAMI